MFNVLGGFGWVASMTLSGYWLGRSIPDIEHRLHWVIGGVILVSFLPLVYEWRRSRKESHQSTGERGALEIGERAAASIGER